MLPKVNFTTQTNSAYAYSQKNQKPQAFGAKIIFTDLFPESYRGSQVVANLIEGTRNALTKQGIHDVTKNVLRGMGITSITSDKAKELEAIYQGFSKADKATYGIRYIP